MNRLTIFLMLCGVAFAVDKYVDTGGNDANTGNSAGAANAYLNVAKAYSTVGDGDTIFIADGTYDDDDYAGINYILASRGITCTIQGNAGDRTAVTYQAVTGESFFIRQQGSLGVMTIKDMTINHNTGGTIGMFYSTIVGTSNHDYTIDNCIVNCGINELYFMSAIATTADGSLTILDSTITSSHVTVLPTKGIGTLSVTNSVITASAGQMFALTQDCGDIYIAGNTLTSAGGTSNHIFVLSGFVSTTPAMLFNSNIVTTSGTTVKIDDSVNIISVENNTIETTAAAVTIQIGKDIVGPDGGDAILRPIVRGNYIEYTGANGSHGILISEGVVNGEISYNTVFGVGNGGLDIGIVIKGTNHNIHHNILRSYYGLYLKGGQQCNVFNNTLLTNSRTALRWDDGEGARPAINNIFTNNIIDGNGGVYAIEADGVNHGDAYFNYNLYRAGSTGIADYPVSAPQSSKQDLIDAWATAAGWDETTVNVFSVDADQNSIVDDPLFMDENGSTVADYMLQPQSPARMVALSDVFGVSGTMGAYQFPQVKGSESRR